MIHDIIANTIISIIEGTRESLARLGLDYVDILFAHRPDHTGTCF
jgi:aryl-alcohol dehydrogenase-like predicted oxidoreductase